MCIKVIFSIRRIGNMYLRYFLSWLFSGGRASFFIFFWLHTLLYHIPFAKKHPSCFCPQGAFLPAFLPASCFPLQPEQTPDGCFAQSRLLNFRSWPSTQGFLARHWLLFAASMSRVWLACRLHAGTTGRVCLLVSCGHVLPKPVASCSTFSLLLLGEVTIIFRRKDSVRSGAA